MKLVYLFINTYCYFLLLLFPSLPQVLFDDIGQSLIRVNSPELKLRLMFHFLQFLGLPTGALDCSSAHTAPWWSSLLEDLSLLGVVPQAQPPLTAYHLPAPLFSPVGHMTTLQGARKWADLGKEGEEFLTNVFQMLLPLFPSKQRAVLYLCWLQYEKLKVPTFPTSLVLSTLLLFLFLLFPLPIQLTFISPP